MMLAFAVLDDNEETGWKYIHGDVFRFPPHKNVFCAFVGTGAQVSRGPAAGSTRHQHISCIELYMSCVSRHDGVLAAPLLLL